MDEILLTHDEQGDAIDTALAHCTRDRELSPVHTVANEVCRAQVLKVADWAKRNNCAPLQADGKRTYTAHLVLPRDAWQALKAAGEGK